MVGLFFGMRLFSAQCSRPPGRWENTLRFGEPFEGPIIPCGAMVEYHLMSAKDESRLHQFGKKVLLTWKDIYWLQILRNWEIWTRQQSMVGSSMQREQ